MKKTITLFSLFFTLILNAQTPCDQRVIGNVDFSYNGGGAAPGRWNVSQTNPNGFVIDEAAFAYVGSGNFSNVNLNTTGGGTNNATRQYAIVSNPNTLSPQFANIPTDGMIVINPLQGQDDQYITYDIAGLIPGNTYYIEIKVWNVIDMAMPGACGSWCNWNDQLYVDMANNQPGAEHSNQNGKNWTGTNGSGTWSQGTNQINQVLKIAAGGSSAVITGNMVMPANGNSLKITLAKGGSNNAVVLGIDYIKIYGCQEEAINVSGGTTNVCEGADITLTAQGLGSAGSAYTWYQNGVLMPGRNSDTLNIFSAVGAGTIASYEARGEWANKTVTLTSKICCSSVGGTSDEVIRQSFNGLTYTCTGRPGGYADIPDKGTLNFIDPVYIYSGTTCDGLDNGHYAVVQTSYAGNFWTNRPEVKDHTGTAGSGALFINAIGGVGQAFYEFNLTGLCAGTRYEFSAWYASLALGPEIKPNIEFEVLNGTTKIESVTTGIIPENSKWYKAEVTFLTPASGSPTYTLQLVNLVTGASGNDVMIDDIVVKKCTPSINLYQDGTKDTVVAVCNDNPVNLKVTTFYDLPLAITGSSSGTVYYQWMEATSPNGPWTLIGAPVTTGTYAATPITTTKYYRAKVSADQVRAATGLPPLATECGNDGMTSSFKLTKDGNFTIPPVTGTTAYCAGSTITLTGDPGTGAEWEWRKGTSFAAATVISGYAFSADPAKKIFTKTFAAADAGNYYFVARQVSGCEGNASITVTANPLATATISGTTTVCQNATSPFVTFTGANGTAPYTFTYNIDGGANQNITTVSGNSITLPVSTVSAGAPVYNLTGVSGSGTSSCSNTSVSGQSATVTINPLPSASIGGTVTVQQNATAPDVTFTGSNGTAPYTFTYNINGGANQDITTATGNSITVAAPTGTPGTFNYNLVSVKDAAAITCTNATTGTATITVSNLPGATISGTTTVCKNGTAPTVTFTGSNGTAPYTFTYNINGGTNQTIATATGNSVTVTAPTGTAGTFIYTLTQVRESSASPITNAVTGQSITITVNDQAAPTGTGASRCGTGTVTLTATASGGAANTIKWYSDAALTTQVATGTSFTTPNITTTTDYYITETSAAGCVSSTSATVTATVNPGPLAPTSSGAFRCGAGTVTLTANLSGGAGNTIKWYSDAALTTQVATGTSFTSPSLSSTTSYYITESNAAGCASVSVTVTATINAIPAVPTVTDGARCGTGTVILSASGGASNVIKWYSDAALTTQVATGTSFTTPSISTTTDYYVTETTVSGCVSTPAVVVKAVISEVPAAGFTSTVDCSNKSATFTNTSNGNGGTITEWTWDYDDGTGAHVLSNGNAFSWSYPNGGTHTVTLAVKTSAGCTNTIPFAQTIVFGAIPAAGFTVGDLCLSNGSATFTNTSTISDGSLMTYAWDFGDGTPVVNVTPAAPPAPTTHTYAAGGSYTVKLTATSNGGCAATADKQVAIIDIPSANGSIENINNLCSSQPVKLTNTSTITGGGTITKVDIFWEYPDLANKTTDNQPVSGTAYPHQYPEFGTPQTKNYTVLIRAYNVNGCFTDFSQPITVLASPKIQLTALASICFEADPVDISSSATDIFSLGGAIAITGDGVSNNIFSPATAGAGTHIINYAATASNGCVATAEQNIIVRAVPVNNFSSSYVVFENQSVKLVPVSPMSSDLTYQWSPGSYLDNTSSPTPTVTNPPEDITYSLKLTSADNCSLDTSVEVIVLSNFTVPNTFTPNNDGYHDTWVLKKLSKYPNHRLQVFNRYGQLVYETTNFPAGGWDGKYKGSLLPFGTYYYIIELGGLQKPKTGYLTIVK